MRRAACVALLVSAATHARCFAPTMAPHRTARCGKVRHIVVASQTGVERSSAGSNTSAPRTQAPAPARAGPESTSLLTRLTRDSVYHSPPAPKVPGAEAKARPSPWMRAIAAEPGVALWRRLAVYCPFLLLLVPGLIGQEATRELQSALGPAGTALALLGDALGSPLVESKEVRDASGVAYATTWVGTPGLALLGGLLLLQMVGNVGERLLTFGVRAPADEDDGNG